VIDEEASQGGRIRGILGEDRRDLALGVSVPWLEPFGQDGQCGESVARSAWQRREMPVAEEGELNVRGRVVLGGHPRRIGGRPACSVREVSRRGVERSGDAGYFDG